ncbi:MAG: ABC-F family ATP-binding cassette domain-containing protein, partial [Clostridia bacterium]|nr:ABC-F family ATP-binding cassette domain-containing protein [Clostridia bacterium]
MITVSEVSFNFSGQQLFKDVNLKFQPGNCYGIIGANGAGKSTFLRLLCGELEPSKGEIFISKDERMSVLKQDHFAYDEFTVLDTVMQGNERLYAVMKEKDAIYEKADFTDEDGERAAELEAEFAEMNGWEAESDASKLLQGLGLDEGVLYMPMSSLNEKEKVKVLLAQALFGNPEIILLDEPTNGLDIDATLWLENFLADYYGIVLVVSHDRHFLNDVCTHIVDIDYGKIKMYVGNYEFWYESSQLMQKLIKQQNKRNEDKIAELQSFISRFSANKSKSRQATARRKLLDKLTVEEMPASSRRYPWIGFELSREAGKDILSVTNLTKTLDGVPLFKDLSFTIAKGEKVAFFGNELALTALFNILMEEDTADSGSFKWGVSITPSYFPHDNTKYFAGHTENIVDWMRQYSQDQTEAYLRGFLGRMLFSGDAVYKQVQVLSGGEKVRCMFSRMMLFPANCLVLDQPTDHLDLESISAVNDGLTAFPGNVLFTSHDYEIVNTVANRIIELLPDGTVLDR